MLTFDTIVDAVPNSSIATPLMGCSILLHSECIRLPFRTSIVDLIPAVCQ